MKKTQAGIEPVPNSVIEAEVLFNLRVYLSEWEVGVSPKSRPCSF